MGVEFRGLPQLRARMKAIGDGRPILRRLQIDTTANAKRLAPHKTRTLSRSIAPGFLTGREAWVHARAPYAAYVEKGTRPHVIRPKRARSLRFPASGVATTLGGRVTTGASRSLGRGAYVFAREVHHPGTKPKPFLLPGAKKAAEGAGLRDLVIDLWNEAA